MAASISDIRKRGVLCLLLISSIASQGILAQKNLSGNLNQPKSHVVSFVPGSDRVTVSDVTGFAAGDTVLLIQMQGAKIYIDPGQYGFISDVYGASGKHEFLIIQSVNTGTREVVFNSNMINPFDYRGNIQLVRVPYYNSATVTGNLYCDPWDPATKSGGVLAMIIGRRLKLTSDINVSGKGFRGARDTIGSGVCGANLEYYDRSFMNAGLKGEGLAIHDGSGNLLKTFAAKGSGPNYTGGGGGDGQFSGGGGGSNRGKGGDGGNQVCYDPYGGSGGKKIEEAYLPNGIFFGGGGGGSTSATPGLTGPGGSGGGIVIIVSDTIISNGGNIVADGGAGGNATGQAGSGGGGAGGSIALSLNSYGSSPLTLSVKGGKGGDNEGYFGEGGGGSGGLIFVSKSTSSSPNVTVSLAGGIEGNHAVGSSAAPGDAGQNKSSFAVILNGFLFNSIRSSVTGDQVDSVCSNTIPPRLTGTIPVGGTAPYNYTWQKSYDNSTWTTVLSDNTSVNYSPPAIETTTVWYRRIVTDSSLPTALTDVSKSVKIIVQPFIKNNIIGSPAIICYAQNPPQVTSLAGLVDGNGIYSFKWEVSTDNTTFGVPSNPHSTENYTPAPALTISSWYRRTVTSGRCVDISSSVKMTVLDTISKNRILNSPPDICFGTTFINLQGSTTSTTPALSGGDNTYRFKWESNINNAGWNTAPGINNIPDYDPQELPQRAPMNEYLFRRVVYSGTGDVCSNTSNTVRLRDYPVITNNNISAPQVICSGNIPAKLHGSIPLNGNGVYTYTWQDSSKVHNWQNISGSVGVTDPDFQPPALTDTTKYRRIVLSSACSDVSNAVKIVVHKPIQNFSIALESGLTDTTICNGQTSHLVKGSLPTGGTGIPGSYNYQWKYSADDLTYNNIPGGTGINYQPAAMTSTTWLKREVTSGACTVIGNGVKIDVLPPISNNIILSDQVVCYNSAPANLTGPGITGGNGSYLFSWEQSTDNGITWIPATGVNNSATGNYSAPALTVKTKYRRNAKSGLSDCCTSVSNIVTIDIHPLPTGVITNTADTTICGGSSVLLKIILTGASPWKVTYKENSADGPVTNIVSSKAAITVVPVTLSPQNIYNYSFSKLEDTYGCIATDISGTKKAIVYKMPVANAGADTIVCGPSVRLHAAASVGTGKWYLPAAAISSTAVTNPGITVVIDSAWSGGSISQKFKWEETNWQCRSKDSVNVQFDKRIKHIFAGNDTSLYSFDKIIRLTNDPVQAWETGAWTVVSGSGTFTDENGDGVPDMITGLGDGPNTFLWKITNGKCSASDQLSVEISSIEIPEGFSPNNDGINDTFIIKGLDLPNQVAELRILNSAGAEIFYTSNRNGSEWTDWDGKDSRGNELAEGTYYYLLRMSSDPSKGGNGQVFKKSGFIILKRY